MQANSHHIRSQVFDVGFYKSTDTMDFQKELSALIRTELSAVLEECLNAEDPQGYVLSIEKLELQLGDIPHDQLKKQLPRRFQEELSKALRRCIYHQSSSTAVTLQLQGEKSIPVIVHFLRKGYMPWNYSMGSKSFDQLFGEVLIQSPIALLEAIHPVMRSDKVKMRLIRNLSHGSITALVRRLEPTEAQLIIHYHRDWLTIQKRKPVFKGSEQEVSRHLWLFIFKYLYDERGSYFNTKSFLVSTLRQTAVQFNITFARLVMLLKLGYDQMSQLTTGSTFNSLIGDIISDFDLAERIKLLSEQGWEIDESEILAIEHIAEDIPEHWVEALAKGQPSYQHTFEQWLENNPASLLQTLRQYAHDEKAVYRIIEPLKETTIHAVVRLLEPTHAEEVIAYHTSLVKEQKSQQLVDMPVRNFPRVIWSMILVILIDDHGSGFNQKAFAKALIRRIANRFNLEHSSLLTNLYQALKTAPKRAESSQLLKIIEDIYRETFGSTQKQTSSTQEQIAQLDPDLLLKSILSGTLHPRLVSAKPIRGGLKHLLWSYLKANPIRFSEILAKGLTITSFAIQLAKVMDPAILIGRLFNRTVPELHALQFLKPEVFKAFINAFLKGNTYEAAVKDNKPLLFEASDTLNPKLEHLIRSIEGAMQQPNWNTTPSETVSGPDMKAMLLRLAKESPVQLRKLMVRVYKRAQFFIELKQCLGTEYAAFLRSIVLITPTWSRVYALTLHKGHFVEKTGAPVKQEGVFFLAITELIVRATLAKAGPQTEQLKALLREVARAYELSLIDLAGFFLALAEQAQALPLKRSLQKWLFEWAADENPDLYASTSGNGMLQYESSQKGLLGHSTKDQAKENATEHPLLILMLKGLRGNTTLAELSENGFSHLKDLVEYLLIYQTEVLRAELPGLMPKEIDLSGLGTKLSYELVQKLIQVLNVSIYQSISPLLKAINPQVAKVSGWKEFIQQLYNLALQQAIQTSATREVMARALIQLLSTTNREVVCEVLGRLLESSKALKSTSTHDIHLLIESLKQPGARPISELLNHHQVKLKNWLSKEFLSEVIPVKRDSTPYLILNPEEKAEVFIDNAGLVLLQPFYPQLFKQLGFLREAEGFDEAQREKAAFALQYVLVDRPPLEEEQLIFNKLLTGLDVNHVFEFHGFTKEEEQRIVQVVHGLIKSMIGHWRAIGASSVDGFRANWLYRKGKLELSEESWELHVERQPYDILLNQLPWSISPVNYSWLQQRLTVYWQ